MKRSALSLATVLLLVACARGEKAELPANAVAAENLAAEVQEEAAAADNAAQAVLPTDAWVGKWIGVEGLVLDVQKAGEPGKYMLGVTLLDGTKSYEGTADGEVIRFTRDGRPESVRAATGDETGLKWLAGKQNCLMIQQGEGFCRDDLTPKAPVAK
ncbi:hypothetical protein [Sphingomonas montanisoli]|uniref:Lipoprotein n=1 Tax=Sphingomonas montanisoli TaxID=2606412 RepID=A0A5D9CBH4_9SPHN|nr:hypothetical protein [Sphingomonas montanisoli]TZG27415.1 hypothetical protein FYJ91_07420 [Sphingomonas montanisoli]